MTKLPETMRAGHPHDSTLTDVELVSIPCSWSTAAHMLSRADLGDGHEIKPVVAATCPLSEIHAAQSAFERKEHVGAIVVTI